MPLDPICPNCGRPVKNVEIETGERIALDSIPTIGGTYALDPNDSARAVKINRPGHQGFNDHAESCPGH